MEDTLQFLIPYNLQLFAQEGPGGEKTEEPTGKRLEDARKKGQVAKSKEVATAFSLLTFFILLRVWITNTAYGLENIFPEIYNKIPESTRMYDGMLPFASMRVIFTEMMLRAAVMVAPFFLVGFVVAFVSDLLQVGFRWTSEPLKPKFSKMNPLSGFKKIFSKQSLFELGKSVLKIVLIGAVVYTYLRGRRESIFLLYDMTLRQAVSLLGDIIINMGIRVSVVYMLIAVLDLVYQRRKFHEDMKMTKQEVKDEAKDSEGDPQIKGKQRARMREASQRRMMQQLPQADVVITNPSHYAVALQYDQERYTAPVVIAKGSDHLAQRIREVAAANDIEIVENKPLARMLYANVELGEMVPPELYKAVAEVLAFVYHVKGKL